MGPRLIPPIFLLLVSCKQNPLSGLASAEILQRPCEERPSKTTRLVLSQSFGLRVKVSGEGVHRRTGNQKEDENSHFAGPPHKKARARLPLLAPAAKTKNGAGGTLCELHEKAASRKQQMGEAFGTRLFFADSCGPWVWLMCVCSIA